jgi:hypothetical protein
LHFHLVEGPHDRRAFPGRSEVLDVDRADGSRGERDDLVASQVLRAFDNGFVE